MTLLRTPPTTQPLNLAPARIHEAGGPGAVAFALHQAARCTGPVIWTSLAHSGESLFPPGLSRLLEPERLLQVRAPSETDLLWAMEEALRSGAAGLVVAAPEKPLSLTAGRRLQLAAEAGRTLGLMLIREGAGSNAAETRWHCAPVWRDDTGHGGNRNAGNPDGGDSTLMHWTLIKNKKGTTGFWTVHRDEKTGSVHMVSQSGERTCPAPSPA